MAPQKKSGSYNDNTDFIHINAVDHLAKRFVDPEEPHLDLDEALIGISEDDPNFYEAVITCANIRLCKQSPHSSKPEQGT